MKISIIGMGRVGSSIAAALVSEQLCKELVLVDLNQEVARAEALDLQHAASVGGSPMRIREGNLSETADSAIVMVTASVSMPPGSTDRNAYARGNGVLMRKKYRIRIYDYSDRVIKLERKRKRDAEKPQRVSASEAEAALSEALNFGEK